MTCFKLYEETECKKLLFPLLFSFAFNSFLWICEPIETEDVNEANTNSD